MLSEPFQSASMPYGFSMLSPFFFAPTAAEADADADDATGAVVADADADEGAAGAVAAAWAQAAALAKQMKAGSKVLATTRKREAMEGIRKIESFVAW